MRDRILTLNQRNIVATTAGAAICATVFIAALLYQFGLLEGVSCIAAWAQLFLLFATGVDALEDRQTTLRHGVLMSLVTTLVVVGWFGADLLRSMRRM
jgi:hypothetical protein